MRLNYLELYGFKSFADKSRLTFEKNISAIVGPNGSGKSNISDAIRWVLGEQSVKSLRGTRMEDVIFSGTDDKKPLNMAQVTISFDNKAGLIPIEYDQVNVTRRVYRSGESEYLINNSQVRLKDIKELFMDTGVGKDGYSIIGQGRIDDILSSRNEDRRYIFEEACGISKYKYKKTDAEKKLIRNEEHLKEIRSELKIKTQEVEILEKQAENARQGIKLTRLLEEKELVLLKFNLDKSKDEIEKLSYSIDDLEKDYSFSKKDYEKYFNKINPIEEKIALYKEDLDQARARLTRLDKEISKNQAEIKLIEEKNNFYSLDLTRIKKASEKRNDLYLKNLEKIDACKVKLDKIQDDLADIKLKIAKKSKKLEDLEEEEKEKLRKIENYGQRKDALTNSLNKLQMDKHTHMEMEKSNEKIKEESIRELNQLKFKIRDGKKNAEDLSRIDDKLSFDMDKKEEEILRKIQEKKDLENLVLEEFNAINHESNRIEQLTSKETILYSIYKNYDGYYKPIQRLLKDADRNPEIKDKIIGVLADLIEVNPTYQLAIDVSLGSALQNIVVKDEKDAQFLINYIKRKNYGRITFLPISKIRGKKAENISNGLSLGVASNLLTYDPRIEGIINHYLARTILVENLQDAVSLTKKIRTYRLVTLEGEIINSWGSMVGGNLYKKESNSLLNRKKEIKDIRLEIANLTKQVVEKKKKYGEDKKTILDLETSLKALDGEKKSLKEAYFKNKDDYKAILLEVSYLEKRYDQVDRQLKSLTSKTSINEEEIENLKNILEKVNRDLDKIGQDRETIRSEKISLEKEILQLEGQLDMVTRDMDIYQNNLSGYISDNHNMKEAEKIDQESLRDLDEKFTWGSKKIEELKLEIEEGLRDLDKGKKDQEDLAEKLLKIERENLEDKNKVEALAKKILDLEKKLYQKELRKENEVERREEAIKSFLLDYSMDRQEMFTRLESLKAGQVERKDIDEIKSQLAEIGFFNPEKIDMYELEKKDLAFLESQYDDLVKTREDILSMIKRLEAQMRLAFNESFNLINEKFKDIFATLFDGGQAELILDSEDVLNAGIEIVARPPGKKLKSIGLLSGGEKSLTAVALLFAIFEINPAPFCVLDEIDAALDEANINKYINYLKSMTDKTQFVIITHRKTTMEMAEILYGVTMEDKGVSKVITLAFDDYKEE